MARAAKKPASKPARKPARAAAPKAVGRAKPAARTAKKQTPVAKRTAARSTAKPASRKPAPRATPKAATKAKGVAAERRAVPARPAVAAPARAAAKPAPAAPAPPKKPRKPELTPKEISNIRAALEAQRLEFLREFAEIEESAFNVSQSEMSGEVSFDEEYADAGSFTFEREKELSIGNNIRDLLEKVNHALAAIARGSYGLCENCGDPIAKARLLALPYSTLCIRCKQLEERIR